MHHSTWKEKIVALAIGLCALVALNFSPGCGVQPKKQVVVESQPDPVFCNGLKPGETLNVACPAGSKGERIQVCRSDGTLADVVNTCEGIDDDCSQGGKTTFKDVEPILAAKCLGCHYAPDKFDDYEIATERAAEFIRRINLAADNRERMPPSPNPELSRDEKNAFDEWLEDGLLFDCSKSSDDKAEDGFIELDEIEASILIDLNRIDSDDRPFTRYLVSAQEFNADPTEASVERSRQAIDKGINSLSSFSNLQRSAPIDRNQTVWRIDLRSYGLTPVDWQAIENADRLQIESFTTKGQLIKQLTGTRLAFIPHDNFLDTVFRNSELYYSLLRIPGTFNELMAQLDVDFAGDLLPGANGQINALAVGFNGSRISNSKNRLLVRHESRRDDLYVWNTFDPVALDGVAQRNLFEFPLLAQTGSQKIFQFAAGETIFALPNGLQGYALFDAGGNRQNVAPINIVRDVDSPISSEIQNANSCTRCHSSGILPARDQVRAHVVGNASNFDIKDVEIVKALYREQATVTAQINEDNSQHGKALLALGVSPRTDPITQSTDAFLQDWTFEKLANYLWLVGDDLEACINGSSAARAQIGQLLEGGTVTYDQVVQIFPVLKSDCRLYQDRIGQ